MTDPVLPKKGEEPVDLTDQYNTKLSPAEEVAYQKWAVDNGRTKDTFDYDMRGAWKSQAGQADNGHYPDTYKKPNHPTFSNESQYSSKDMPGGKWGDGTFTPSSTNLKNMSASALLQYMHRVEPDTKLVLPTKGK